MTDLDRREGGGMGREGGREGGRGTLIMSIMLKLIAAISLGQADLHCCPPPGHEPAH
jgi:hypothetical protein